MRAKRRHDHTRHHAVANPSSYPAYSAEGQDRLFERLVRVETAVAYAGSGE